MFPYAEVIQPFEPLIYTIKGNLPLSMLEYKAYRQDVPGSIVFIEEYFLNGESVKRAVHVLPVMGICREGDFGVETLTAVASLPGATNG